MLGRKSSTFWGKKCIFPSVLNLNEKIIATLTLSFFLFSLAQRLGLYLLSFGENKETSHSDSVILHALQSAMIHNDVCVGDGEENGPLIM